jgi:hypothetical protein
VSPHLLLGKNRMTIHHHLEDPSRRLDHSNISVRICLLQLSRQTGSSWVVVSNYAVLNRYTHLRHRLRE